MTYRQLKTMTEELDNIISATLLVAEEDQADMYQQGINQAELIIKELKNKLKEETNAI